MEPQRSVEKRLLPLATMKQCAIHFAIMTCSWFGVFAIFLSITALIISTAALCVPMWSSTSHGVTNVKFTTGVWGFCVNANVHALYLTQCFSFYKSTDMSNSITLDDTTLSIANVNITLGVCSTSNYSAPDVSVDSAAFDAFLLKSCSSLGKTSLAFAILSVACSILSCLVLVLIVVCCTSTSCIVYVGKVFSVSAGICMLIAVCTWASQVQPIASATSFGLSFLLEAFACTLSLTVPFTLLGYQTHCSTLNKEVN